MAGISLIMNICKLYQDHVGFYATQLYENKSADSMLMQSSCWDVCTWKVCGRCSL